MTIQSLGAAQDSSALAQASAGRRPHTPPPDAFKSTASLLGVSTDDLKSQLDSGETLDSLASAKGVSSNDLLSAVTQDLKDNRPAGAPPLSDDRLTAIASGIASGTGPRGVGGFGHGQPPSKASGTTASDPTQTLQSLADVLGTTPDDLLTQMQSGTDLSSLFNQSGSATWGSKGASTSGLAVDLYA
jgi:hypothetical protein